MRTAIALTALALSVPVAAKAAGAKLERPSWFIFQSASGFEEPMNTVVRDQATWEAMWGRLHARIGPFKPAPRIDFASKMVLMAALGEQSNGGSSIRIASVKNGSREIVATVERRGSGPGCAVTMAFTQPTDVVVVPASTKPIRWRFRNVVKGC